MFTTHLREAPGFQVAECLAPTALDFLLRDGPGYRELSWAVDTENIKHNFDSAWI